MAKKKHTICVIGGDGIGPEVVNETIRLLLTCGINFSFVEAAAGYGAYEIYGTPLPPKTVSLCKKSDAILFGAVTTPPNIPNYFSPIVRLRKMLGLYANVRPITSLPIKGIRPGINMIIVRENTEDLYVGQERITKEGAIGQRVITRKASKRIVEFAFELARKKNFKKVTLVHKANVMRLTDGLFLQIGQEISKKYEDIVFEEMLVDACAMRLVTKPDNFEIIVTTNMFGDILSDEACALVGGLGIASSANVSGSLGLFEPVHGSAPKYKGMNRANPMACFFAACLMLDFLNEKKTGDMIRQAILTTLKQGIKTVDLGGRATMTQFTDKVIKIMKN